MILNDLFACDDFIVRYTIGIENAVIEIYRYNYHTFSNNLSENKFWNIFKNNIEVFHGIHYIPIAINNIAKKTQRGKGNVILKNSDTPVVDNTLTYINVDFLDVNEMIVVYNGNSEFDKLAFKHGTNVKYDDHVFKYGCLIKI